MIESSNKSNYLEKTLKTEGEENHEFNKLLSELIEKNNPSILYYFETQIKAFANIEDKTRNSFQKQLLRGLSELPKAELALRIGDEEKATELMGEDYFSHPNFFVALSYYSPKSPMYKHYSPEKTAKQQIGFEAAGIDIRTKVAEKAYDYFEQELEHQKKLIKEHLPEIWRSYADIRDAKEIGTIHNFFIMNQKFEELQKYNQVITDYPFGFQKENKMKKDIALEFLLACLNTDKDLTLKTIKEISKIQPGNYVDRIKMSKLEELDKNNESSASVREI